MPKQRSKKGFTLIELMVVMALMAVLATLIIGAITIARKSAKYAEARKEMSDIRSVFENFLIKKKELPPTKGSLSSNGDYCDYCRIAAGTPSNWVDLLTYLKGLGYMDEAAVTRYSTDPWGNPYAYDDNYGQQYGDPVPATRSLLCTTGPDGTVGNGDDECPVWEHEGLKIW